MKRTWSFGRQAIPLLSMLLLLGCGTRGVPVEPEPAAPTHAAMATDKALVISAFYVNPLLKGGPEECIRVANVSGSTVDIADFSLSDIFGPSAGDRYVRRGEGRRRDIAFPTDSPRTRLAPGSEVTVARDATAYLDQFGELPDFEFGEDRQFPADRPDVPNMRAVASRQTRRQSKTLWPTWPARGADAIALFGGPDPAGDTPVLDVVVWDFKGRVAPEELLAKLRAYERDQRLPREQLWRGPPLNPRGELAGPYGLRTRVFIRDRDAEGQILPDTASYRDWDSGSSLKHLGEDPTHRVMMAGQSSFLPHRSRERAVITVSAAPDNDFAALKAAIDEAREDIKLSVYYMTNLRLGDALVAAIRRGVDVTLYFEGTTVGVANGFTDTERYIARAVEQAGRERSRKKSHGLGRAYWLQTKPSDDVADRYWFDHSKYLIVDGRKLIVGSENYGMSGHPVDPTHGNRGWEIHVATPDGSPPLAVVQALEAVWRDDVDPEHHRDVVRYSDAKADIDRKTGRGRYGPPPRGYDPEPDREVPGPGTYVPVAAPETFEETATFELVLSPDNSHNEHTGILGAIAAADEEILVQHLDLRLYWGSRVRSVARTPETTPSLVLQALLAAARRGVRVRVLLDCSRFNCNPGPEERDPQRDNNDDTVAYLREIAAREGLDLQARAIDIRDPSDDRFEDREDAGLVKIHNKGLIIDRKVTLVSSINGSENSMKGNREVGLLVTSPRVAAYYGRLFWYDWTTMDAPRRLEAKPGAIPGRARCAPDEGRTGWMLDGLSPDTEYFVAVSAYDDDLDDYDVIDRRIRVGPHESALSNEVRVRSSSRGRIGLAWDMVRSEDAEGDLAGYRIYFGKTSGDGATTREQVERAGAYRGDEDRDVLSPVEVPGGCPLPRRSTADATTGR